MELCAVGLSCRRTVHQVPQLDLPLKSRTNPLYSHILFCKCNTIHEDFPTASGVSKNYNSISNPIIINPNTTPPMVSITSQSPSADIVANAANPHALIIPFWHPSARWPPRQPPQLHSLMPLLRWLPNPVALQLPPPRPSACPDHAPSLYSSTQGYMM